MGSINEYNQMFDWWEKASGEAALAVWLHAELERENTRLRAGLVEIVAMYPNCTNTRDMRDIALSILGGVV